MAAGRRFVVVGGWLELLVDVESFVVGLSEWIVGFVREVKGTSKKLQVFRFVLNRNLMMMVSDRRLC